MLDESLLDNADRIATADRNGLLRMLATAGAQVRESIQLADESEVDGYLADQRPRAVLLCCDASTEVAARTVQALADWPDCPAPVLLHSGTELPVWAGPADLMLVSALAGDDERVLSLTQAAARRGVSLAGVGPAPSPLEEACLRARGGFVPLPGGRPSRAALWSVLAPLVLMARPLGLAPVQREDLAAAADLLDGLAVRCRPTSDTFVNPAKSLAVSLANTIPVAWGSTGLTGVAAYRLATQLAGNAGLPALSGTMPTAARLFGGVFDGAGAVNGEDIFRDRVEEDEPRRPRLLLLREADEDPDIRAELAALMSALTDRGATYGELTAEVGGPVTGLASLIGLLDFVTVYTGLLLGVDPSGARIGQGAL